jgi:hypothetical protein
MTKYNSLKTQQEMQNYEAKQANIIRSLFNDGKHEEAYDLYSKLGYVMDYDIFCQKMSNKGVTA